MWMLTLSPAYFSLKIPKKLIFYTTNSDLQPNIFTACFYLAGFQSF